MLLHLTDAVYLVDISVFRQSPGLSHPNKIHLEIAFPPFFLTWEKYSRESKWPPKVEMKNHLEAAADRHHRRYRHQAQPASEARHLHFLIL